MPSIRPCFQINKNIQSHQKTACTIKLTNLTLKFPLSCTCTHTHTHTHTYTHTHTHTYTHTHTHTHFDMERPHVGGNSCNIKPVIVSHFGLLFRVVGKRGVGTLHCPTHGTPCLPSPLSCILGRVFRLFVEICIQ